MKWAIHTVKPLPSFASDGVVLLGDAVSILRIVRMPANKVQAHAMAPHQGSAAGQAIEV
jgi:salicylate hydroxylase